MDRKPYEHGIELFHAGDYFAAHEVWEDLWRDSRGERKAFLQALIQIAVALHHHGRGNVRGARSLLARAERNLAELPRVFEELDVAALHAELIRWQGALANGRPVPPAPLLRRVGAKGAGGR